MTVDKNRVGVVFMVGILLGLAGMTGCGIAPQKPETPAAPPAETKERTNISEADVSASDVPKERTYALQKDDFGVSSGVEDAAELSFAMAGSLSGLSQEALGQIEALNRGQPPEEAIGMEALQGYYALVGTTSVIGRDKESGEETQGRGRLTIYVPNLLSSLEDVSVLFYDNSAGLWRVLAVEKTDAKAKTLSVILPGSGTLTVIYKAQG